MIITIQKSTKGYMVTFIDSVVEFEHSSLQQVTKELGKFSDNYFKHTEERPTIKILPIQSKPMATKSRTASTNPGNKMSTSSTDKSWRPAKKKAVAKKKVVAKGKKK